MFGPTGLDMLICRNECVIHAHIYTASCILAHDSLDVIHDRHVAFPAALVGNQIATIRSRSGTPLFVAALEE